MMKRRLAAGLLALTMVLGLAACASKPENPDSGKGETLTFTTGGESGT